MNTTTATICNKIDIHSHLLFNVDDGSKTIDEALKTLDLIKDMGITDIVCTPHFLHPNTYDYKKVMRNFNKLKSIYQRENINLYLGNEIYLNNNTSLYLKESLANTINNTKYILIELGRRENKSIYYIYQMIEQLIDNGYKVIIAHVEFYKNYRDIKIIEHLRKMGVLIQIDSESVVNKRFYDKTFRYSKKLLKKQYVDIVCSDFHNNAKRNYEVFDKSYKYILKKYKYEYTNQIFYLNPKEIINSKKIS